jgi:hypothetical protein
MVIYQLQLWNIQPVNHFASRTCDVMIMTKESDNITYKGNSRLVTSVIILNSWEDNTMYPCLFLISGTNLLVTDSKPGCYFSRLELSYILLLLLIFYFACMHIRMRIK